MAGAAAFLKHFAIEMLLKPQAQLTILYYPKKLNFHIFNRFLRLNVIV